MADIPINEVTRRVQFTGNTTTGPFAFTFNILSVDDIVVFKNFVQQTITTDYTVSTNTNGTGSITLTSALVASDVLTIVGGRRLERTTDFVTAGDLLASSLNEQLDSQVIMMQQLDEKLDRSLKVDIGDQFTTLTLPSKANRLGRVLGFNATSGDPEAGPAIADVSSLASITADIATLADIEDGTNATNAIQNVAAIVSNVSTVAGISGNVTTVAGISSNVTTVAGISGSIPTVAADSTHIQSLGPISGDITTVASVASNVTTVASNINSVNSVATNIASVITVANDLAETVSEIETVANDLNEAASEIDIVANNISNVNAVGAVSADVTTVAGIASDVTSVVGISANIQTIANSAATTNINTVAADLNGANNIGTVAGALTNINTVGTNISNVNVVAGNISSVANFADKYEVSANAPSNPTEGLLWFDTSTDTMKVYNGNSFQNAGSSVNGTSIRGTFTATAAQTTFTTPGYDSGFIDIYLNGVKQIVGTDVTATNGTTFVFASGLAAGDVVEYVAFGTFQLTSVYTQAQSDARYPLLGADVDFGSYKIKYSNVYSQISDLPSASTYHGMFAHVHATGAGYFAHAGNWLKLVNEDTSGNVIISGNLTVQGSTTTVDSTTLNVTDKNITVANGAADAAAANDAGLTIDGANATLLYKSSGDKFLFNKDIETTGTVTGSNTTFDILSSATTVAKNTRNACDVSSAAFTMTLPSSAQTGDFVEIRQIAGDFSVNNLTVAGNGNNINGDTTLIVDVAYAQLALVYNGTEWRVS